MLPKRREPVRSGITRAPKREWPRHRKFVRSHVCCVENGMCCGPIEAAHVRIGTDGGISQKPSDWWLISLCRSHHAQQHVIGETSFETTHRINMKKLAAEFAKASPDKMMIAAMKEAGIV